MAMNYSYTSIVTLKTYWYYLIYKFQHKNPKLILEYIFNIYNFFVILK